MTTLPRRGLEGAEFTFHKIIVERSTVSAIGIAGIGNLTFPERTLILPVDVKVVGKIDFSEVTNDNITQDGDKLIFTLPDPTLLIESVDPDYKMKSKASREQWYRGGSFSNKEIQKVLEQAKDSVMTDRILALMVERTRANAASVLIPLIAYATGVSENNIVVQFDTGLSLHASRLRKDTIIFRRKELGNV
jgi:hypothetical protein